MTLEKGATWRRPDPCTGYVRRVTHDEIADAVGYNSREVLGTTACRESEQKGQSVAASGSRVPRHMVKAGLLEPQSPMMEVHILK